LSYWCKVALFSNNIDVSEGYRRIKAETIDTRFDT